MIFPLLFNIFIDKSKINACGGIRGYGLMAWMYIHSEFIDHFLDENSSDFQKIYNRLNVGQN